MEKIAILHVDSSDVYCRDLASMLGFIMTLVARRHGKGVQFKACCMASDCFECLELLGLNAWDCWSLARAWVGLALARVGLGMGALVRGHKPGLQGLQLRLLWLIGLASRLYGLL